MIEDSQERSHCWIELSTTLFSIADGAPSYADRRRRARLDGLIDELAISGVRQAGGDAEQRIE